MVRELSPEKRARYLSAALKLFAANGVQNTTTAEIAKEAGTAAGTLFLYFPTKQDLVHTLVLDIASEQSAAIRERLQPSQSARESFAAIWQGSIRWFRDHPDAYRYVQQVRDSSLISAEVVRESEKSLAYYFEAIQKGLIEGSIKPYPLELIGGMLYQGIVAVMNLVQSQPDPRRQDELIHAGFAIFWDGIKAQPVSPPVSQI